MSLTPSLHNPSLMSSFANLKGVFSSYLSASVAMSHWKFCTRCIIASAGSYFTVAEFTDFIIFPLCRIWKETTKIVWWDFDLCGIMATGGMFSISGSCSLAIHILSPCHICWSLSPFSRCAVLPLPLLCQLRGVVLGIVPPLCVTPFSLTYRL